MFTSTKENDMNNEYGAWIDIAIIVGSILFMTGGVKGVLLLSKLGGKS